MQDKEFWKYQEKLQSLSDEHSKIVSKSSWGDSRAERIRDKAQQFIDRLYYEHGYGDKHVQMLEERARNYYHMID